MTKKKEEKKGLGKSFRAKPVEALPVSQVLVLVTSHSFKEPPNRSCG